jgi:ABC-type branched-subunit amino acid transport system substrate-binding protein
MKMRMFLVVTLLLVACLCLVGCSSKRSAGGAGGRMGPPLEAPTDFERLPFEIWSYGQDLTGQSLTDESIRFGDEALKKGDFQRGLGIYKSIDMRRLSQPESEALAARLATAYLATNVYDDALLAVSNYCDVTGVPAQSVTGQLALLLGYGYGAQQNYDQALAWFGRAATTETGSPIYADASEKAVRLLIAAIPTTDFDLVFAKWKDDQNFGGIFMQEKARREDPKNRNTYSAAPGGAFWRRNLPSYPTMSTPIGGIGNAPAAVTLGVILPLSGPLAPLGEGTRNGMELAMQVENEPNVHVEFKDAQESVVGVQTALQDLTGQKKADFIIGPLLSEQAASVRQASLAERIPMLSLTKGNVFETGDIVFRFGATSNSQMDTLLDAASMTAGISRFALVYPESPIGLEYANAFKKYVTAKGLQVLYEATYRAGDAAKLETIAADVSRLNVGGMFIPDSLEGAKELLSHFSESARERIRPMGPATWDSPQTLAQSPALFNRAIFISPFFVGSSNPLMAKFIAEYRKKFGKAPDFLAAQGFDAMTIAIGAARQTLKDGTPLDLAMKNIDAYDGLTGSMRVDTSGEVQRAYAVLEVKDGRIQAISGKEENQNQVISQASGQ